MAATATSRRLVNEMASSLVPSRYEIAGAPCASWESSVALRSSVVHGRAVALKVPAFAVYADSRARSRPPAVRARRIASFSPAVSQVSPAGTSDAAAWNHCGLCNEASPPRPRAYSTRSRDAQRRHPGRGAFEGPALHTGGMIAGVSHDPEMSR
jgi:hypothetical protein